MENENVVADNSNTAEEEVLETSQEETQEESSNESDDELQAELAKARELANNYKVRAEKAERLAKQKPSEPQKQSGELGTTDVIYLAKADIHDDDMDEVLKHAKLHNVSVKEAHSYLKPILDVRVEQRKTAEASNVGSSKRGSGKISDEVLLSKASKGEISGNDADIERLIEARFQAKKGK